MLTLLMTLLVLVAIILIVLILVQKGRGGGLAGALGGMGGQSAFGAKAGDLFTRITIVVATIWILLSVVTFSYCSRMGRDLEAPPSGVNPADGAVPGLPATPDTSATPGTEPSGLQPGSSSTESGSAETTPATPN